MADNNDQDKTRPQRRGVGRGMSISGEMNAATAADGSDQETTPALNPDATYDSELTSKVIRLHGDMKMGSIGFEGAMDDFVFYMERGKRRDHVKPEYRYMFDEIMGTRKEPPLPDTLDAAIKLDEAIEDRRAREARNRSPKPE